MTDKAYIVANEQQEREVLENLEQEGLMWSTGRKPTERMPSSISFSEFPYVLFSRHRLSWGLIGSLSDEEIVFDGRKDENMSKKYVVSQEFMNALKKWKDNLKMNGKHSVYDYDIHEFSDIIEDWWSPVGIRDYEQNNRLIAILRWVNGEDVFEVEKPKKWVVRSKDSSEADRHLYVRLNISYKVKDTTTLWGISNATRFDTKEEAESWANSHQEVIEVEE